MASTPAPEALDLASDNHCRWGLGITDEPTLTARYSTLGFNVR